MNRRTTLATVSREPRRTVARPWYQRAAAAVGGWFKSLASLRITRLGRSGYEGAVTSRRTDGWLTSNLSANSQIQIAGTLLRSRSRDLVRNNPHAAKAISSLVSNTIGTGVRPMSDTGDKALDSVVDRLFAKWALDVNFYGKQSLAFRGMLESGETLTRRQFRREDDGLAVPVDIQLLEADFLDSAESRSLQDGGRIVMGKQFDARGMLTQYWMFAQHPGENVRTMSGRSVSNMISPVPARDIAHLYEPLRPGQVRGVPHLTPVLRALRDLDDYADAERFRKKLESCVVAFVMGDEESEEGLGPQVTDSSGEILEQMEPGLIALVRGGKDVRMSAPATIGGYAEYKRAELQAIAAGARMTYETLASDLSSTSFSSIKAGWVEYKVMIGAVQQHIVIPAWCRPVRGWFIEGAIASGALPEHESGYPAKWTPPAFVSIDRLADAQADKVELRGGLVTLPTVVARRGGDFDVHVAEIVRSNAALDEAEIVLDSDARRVSNAGIEQASLPVAEVAE